MLVKFELMQVMFKVMLVKFELYASEVLANASEV